MYRANGDIVTFFLIIKKITNHAHRYFMLRQRTHLDFFQFIQKQPILFLPMQRFQRINFCHFLYLARQNISRLTKLLYFQRLPRRFQEMILLLFMYSMAVFHLLILKCYHRMIRSKNLSGGKDPLDSQQITHKFASKFSALIGFQACNIKV